MPQEPLDLMIEFAVSALASGDVLRTGALVRRLAQDFSGDEVAVVSFDGETATWSEAAWEVWSLCEAALAMAMAVEVRVAADATIVTLVDEESAGGDGSCLGVMMAAGTLPGPPACPICGFRSAAWANRNPCRRARRSSGRARPPGPA